MEGVYGTLKSLLGKKKSAGWRKEYVRGMEKSLKSKVDLEGIKKWIQEGSFKVDRSYIDKGRPTFSVCPGGCL